MRAVALVAFAAAAAGQSIKPGCLPAAEGLQDLWCPGDNGYQCYKIPSLLRVPGTSTLLGFIEARKHSCKDDGDHVDILMRRSEDMGATWGGAQVVWTNSSDPGNSTDPSGVPKEYHTIGDALPVWDSVTNQIHLVFTRDNKDAFYTRSDDKGMTWSEPRNISSEAVTNRGPFCGTGHAKGVQLSSGRVLVPMYGCGLKSFVLASDDHGASWQIIGALDAGPNEWVIEQVEKGSDTLLGNLRSEGSRLQSTSTDGGKTWAPTYHVKSLPEPLSGCEAGVVLHPNGKLYYSHPDEPPLRNLMNIKVSADSGKTWTQHKTIWGPGAGCEKPCVPAASYSSMAVLGDSADSPIGLFFMRNNKTMIIFEGTPSFTTFAP